MRFDKLNVVIVGNSTMLFLLMFCQARLNNLELAETVVLSGILAPVTSVHTFSESVWVAEY